VSGACSFQPRPGAPGSGGAPLVPRTGNAGSSCREALAAERAKANLVRGTAKAERKRLEEKATAAVAAQQLRAKEGSSHGEPRSMPSKKLHAMLATPRGKKEKINRYDSCQRCRIGSVKDQLADDIIPGARLTSPNLTVDVVTEEIRTR